MPATALLWSTPAQRDHRLDQIAATGVRWMRLDIYMDQLTWVNASQIDWAVVDATVTAARQRNLNIIGLLATLPTYSRPAGSPNTYGPTTAAQRDLFADFAAKAAQRYKGKVDTWEVWNEPNTDQFWYPAPRLDKYDALLAATYQAIKSTVPGATVLSGGTGGRDSSADVEPSQWLKQLYGAGLANDIDGVAIHAYTAPENGNLGEVERFSIYREIMDSNGDQHAQLWVTEAGTQIGRSASANEQLAASNITAITEAWKRVHDRGPLIFYTLSDSIQAGFGLYRADDSSRPAVAALTDAAGTPT